MSSTRPKKYMVYFTMGGGMGGYAGKIMETDSMFVARIVTLWWRLWKREKMVKYRRLHR